MGYDRYRVSVEVLENGFKVELPDMEAIAKKQADAKKRNPSSSGLDCYIGDCTKSFAAKSVKEVLALVKGSLEKMPENEYDAAFNAAAGKKS